MATNSNSKQFTKKERAKANSTGAKNKILKKDLLDSINEFFLKRDKAVLYLSLGFTFFFSILLFDAKVSIGGDDSAYITRAFDLVHGFIFPGYQGPLYPFVLSIFIGIFGIKLVILKLISLVSVMVSVYLIYRTFSGRLPQSVVAIIMILLSINYSLLYYSSQTYSEAFYLMLQSFFFWFVAKKFIDSSEKSSYKDYLIIGLLLFMLTLTRNIAYAAVIGVVGYFLLNRQWRNSVMTLGGFVVSYGVFGIIKRILWGNSGAQLSSQASAILYKDFYNPSKGNEDFMGMVDRFECNSNLFFSKHLFNFLGLRNNTIEVNTFLTILVWAVLLGTFLWALRKNKLLLFTSIYTICMCATSFIVLQKQWDQSRIIIIYLPLFLVILFAGIYHIAKSEKFKTFQFVLPLVACIIFLSSFSLTMKNVKNQSDSLVHNLSGDFLYGFSPDWKNYILMSRWAAKNTPPNYYTAVRKGDISFIYGGRKFYNVTKVPTITPDSLLRMMSDYSMVNVGVSMEGLIKAPLFSNPHFRESVVAFINGTFSFGNHQVNEGNIVGVYRIRLSEFPLWEQQLKQQGIAYEVNIQRWIENLKSLPSEYAIYVPDMLVDQMKKANVKYFMLASLRVNPASNTGNIITTLHRFVYFIQLKYPERFKLLNTIGTQEPAQLFELTY